MGILTAIAPYASYTVVDFMDNKTSFHKDEPGAEWEYWIYDFKYSWAAFLLNEWVGYNKKLFYGNAPF